MDSRKPSPITLRALSNAKLGKPTCAAALTSALAIMPVESAKVPSQSHTIKSNCLPSRLIKLLLSILLAISLLTSA